MANRIYIDPEAKDALDQWTEESPGYTLAAYNFFDKCEMYLQGIPGTSYISAKKDIIKLQYIASKGNQLPETKNVKVNLEIKRTREGKHDFQIKFSATSEAREHFDSDELQSFVTLLAQCYLQANAFLIYGNLQEDRVLLVQGKNEGEDKVIVFRLFEGKVYAAQTGTHRSPEGIFSVRGHFRRYKSGKVVWIDQYLKGLERERI